MQIQINPSMAHFPTRNIAGILESFWPQCGIEGLNV